MGLLAKLGLDSSEFKTGLDKAKKEVQGFSKGATKMFQAVAASFVVTGIVAGLKSIATHFKELTKQARLLDTTTQAIERMTYVAERGGATFENMADALHDATEKAQDAAAGNEGFTAAFERMNISVEEFLGMDAEEKLAALADGFVHAEKNGMGFFAANELLGGAAQELIPILKGGAEAIREVGDAAATTDPKIVAMGENLDGVFKEWKNFWVGFFSWLFDTMFSTLVTLERAWDDVGHILRGVIAGVSTETLRLLDIMGAIATLDFSRAAKSFGEIGSSFGKIADDHKDRMAQFGNTMAAPARLAEMKKEEAKKAREASAAKAIKDAEDKAAASAKKNKKEPKELWYEKKDRLAAEKKYRSDRAQAKKDAEKRVEDAKKAAKKRAADAKDKAAKNQDMFADSKNNAIAALFGQKDKIKGDISDIKNSRTPSDTISSSLAAVGGGGNAFMVSDPALDEAKKQTALLDAIAKLNGVNGAIDKVQATEYNNQ